LDQGAAVAVKAPSLTGVKVLLEGPTGTGKTRALGTLIDWAGVQNPPVEVCCLFVERGLETLLGYYTEQNKPIPNNLFWRDLVFRPVSLQQMKDAATNIGRLTYDSIVKLTDGQRSFNNPVELMLANCMEFVDDRSGKKFGAVDAWGPERIFVVDSLSALADAYMKMTIGSKPVAAQNEYQVAQNNIMNFLRLCTQGCRCHFVLTAHVSRETDFVTGGSKIMTQAIGSAISPLIPPLFSEVILTAREGATWHWDTANMSADLKTRYLPVAAKLMPDFRQIMDKWVARSKAAAAPVPA
jgi:hypothetical protein